MREWEEQILSHIKNMLFYLVFLNVNIYIFNTTIVMIDDKKIEEAAQGTADLYEQDLPIMSYNEDTEVDGQHHFCQEFGAELFKDGAKWAINEFLKNLWHPASEMPDKNRTCLVRVVYHPNHGMFQDEERIEQSSFHDFGWYDYDFKYIGTNYDIISWLYIDDLLPKEGGEQ